MKESCCHLPNANPQELALMKKKLKIAVPLAIPLFTIAMLDMFPSLSVSKALGTHFVLWLQGILASIIIWGPGFVFFKKGYDSLFDKKANMFTLIGIGVGVAYFYSLAAILSPQYFPDHIKTHHGMPPLYFESAAVIIVLVIVGQILEMKAKEKTSSALKDLLGLQPKTALKEFDDGRTQLVAIQDIHVGDKIRIKPGEKIPIDGVIVSGESSIDESMISGEPIPIDKFPGQNVISGTINHTGSILVKTAKIGDHTLVAQIIQLVKEAEKTKAPIQKKVDKVSAIFVPSVLAISLITFFVWFYLGNLPLAITNAVAVLIIACPCALGLATPISIMVTTGRSAKNGILFRNAEAIEKLDQVNLIILDKTGTLTSGKPVVSEITPYKIAREELLSWAASIEKLSEHPIANAIVTKSQEENLNLLPVSNFKSQTGFGLRGFINHKEILIGNQKLLNEIEIPPQFVDQAEAFRSKGQTVFFVAISKEFSGLLSIQDEIKSSSLAAIAAFHKNKIKVVMATGDQEATAKAIAQDLQIDEYHSGMLPADKANLVKKYQSEGFIVAMVGDGTNDAPALSASDVGIAMGTGTDIAVNSAHVTLVRGDLNSVVEAIDASANTVRNIHQNLYLAFGYNALCIPIAAGLLYPFNGLFLDPMLAAGAMTLSSLSVIFNALRSG